MAAALDDGGSTPVILLDTPCPQDHADWRLPLGEAFVALRTGALPVIREGDTRVVFFDARASARCSGGVIEVHPLAHADALVADWPAWFGSRLERTPEHWHLWPFVGPLLQTCGTDRAG